MDISVVGRRGVSVARTLFSNDVQPIYLNGPILAMQMQTKPVNPFSATLFECKLPVLVLVLVSVIGGYDVDRCRLPVLVFFWSVLPREPTDFNHYSPQWCKLHVTVILISQFSMAWPSKPLLFLFSFIQFLHFPVELQLMIWSLFNFNELFKMLISRTVW